MSDIRALLLTDVVDSTKLSERLGDSAMAEVWAQHDRVARDLLPPHGGREIDKTDGMLLMFDTSPQAVAYALAYHHALSVLPEPLKARAGLHVGPVVLRENSADDVARGAKPLEVDGLAKPTAARVMSLAVGAQTLLTAEAFADLGESALQTQSHGHWMVKGVSEPIEIFEVAPAGQAMVQPPDSEKVFRVVRNGDWWLPVKEIPNNLPQPGTSFIGREKEQADVMALLGRVRLVTLLGMGGLGKTRLSLEVAVRLMHAYPDGVWFLDLSPITDPALVVSEAAQMMGVREEPGRALIQSVCAHLKTRRALLVFDNCEHLLKPTADLAHAVIKGSQNVRIVASSREAMRVPGEHAFPVLPLPVPAADDELAVLQQSTAVRLFVARAQSHKPAFELDAENASSVAQLVARLEGIPLALELAAARVRAMSVSDINKRLNDRYKLLTGGARVHQERQQTLRALVDWSYDLLQDTEKTLLNRLAVFKGGMDLEAVEAICGTDPLDPLDVLDLVTSLVEKSLVTVVETDDTTRYRMLETIREYAKEKLEESGEQDDVFAKHCTHYFEFSKTTRNGYQGDKQKYWLDRAELENDNFRTAISSAQNGIASPVFAVKFAVALQRFWILRGYLAEGRAVVQKTLDLNEIDSSNIDKAHCLYVGATLAVSQSDYGSARAMLEICLRIRRQLGNKTDIATTLSTLARVALESNDPENAGAFEAEAFTLFCEVGRRDGEAIGLLLQGEIALFREDDERAAICFQQSLAIAKQIKYREIERECEIFMGRLALYAGDLQSAQSKLSKAHGICQESDDREGAAGAQQWLGKVAMDTGDFPSAKVYLTNALKTFDSFEIRRQVLSCLLHFADYFQLRGVVDLAIQVAAAVDQSRVDSGIHQTPREKRSYDQWLISIKNALEPVAFSLHWQQGSERDIKETIALVLSKSAI